MQYDFVEVMACPGGCVGGGGQPISAEDEELYGVRGERLYTLDAENPMRFSHENPEVQALYHEYLGGYHQKAKSGFRPQAIFLNLILLLNRNFSLFSIFLHFSAKKTAVQ